MDGHDKLMGYQNSMFPLAVYGAIDTASRKILWLKIWISNSSPKRIGLWYLEQLYETKTIPSMICVDKGTESGVMATTHAYLRQNHGDMDAADTVLYGPSTSNQVTHLICIQVTISRTYYHSVHKNRLNAGGGNSTNDLKNISSNS